MGLAGNWQIWSGLRPVEVEDAEELMSEQAVVETTKRPFYKRTEWWLLIAALVFGGLLGSGVLGGGKAAQIAAMVIEALAAMGYTIGRGIAKSAEGSATPGYKSSEFWSSLAAGGLMAFQATDVVPQGSPAEGILAAILAALPVGGYAVARGKVKAAETLGLVLIFALSALPVTGCVATATGQHKFDAAQALDTACAVSPALNAIVQQGVCANLPEPKKSTCLLVSNIVNATAGGILAGAASIYGACRDPNPRETLERRLSQDGGDGL